MRGLFIFELLVFSAFTKHSLCVSANAAKNAWTFFKRGTSLPGPTMSFNASLNNGIFEFEFKTFVDRALILYQDSVGNWDYFRLSINQGYLHFSFVYDVVDELSVKTEMQYNDFKWHTVKIERNSAGLKLYVDGKIKVNQTADLTTLSSHLQLGGFPSSRANKRTSITDPDAIELYADQRGFFFGCVRNVRHGLDEARMMRVEDISSLRSYARKGSCNLTLCDKRVNKPPGVCENQGVCIPSGENSATCDCRWTGYTGPTCTEDALRLILNGSYKVAYKLPTRVVVKQELFKLRIKTARKNAIVLLGKATEESSDQLRLEIKNSKFFMTFSGRVLLDNVTLRSNEVISDNEWHLVSYQRNKILHSLTVDGKSVNFTSKESNSDRNYHILFIGENKTSMKATVEMEDFIWEYQNKEINFIKGVYELFSRSNDEYTVIPKGVTPMFNWELPTKDGYMNVSLTTASTFIDGCKKKNIECHSHAYCSSINKSYECLCETGYTGDGISCTDIDECETSPCHEKAQCRNTNGSYKCACRPGFHGDGFRNCSDVDECSVSQSFCSGQCTNTFGSYSCHCLSGFTGDGKHNCTDVDECVLSNDTCDEHELCINTEGSFFCDCDPDRGFRENKNGNCTDIDECSDKSICHALATCVNTKGSFMCQCLENYHGDGVSKCLPNHHCDAVPCFPGLKCSSANDSYTCEKCPQFFYGDGINCTRNESKNFEKTEGELVLTNEQWTAGLGEKSSKVYKTLASQLIKKIRKVYKEHPEFVYAFIKKFRKGSVVAEFSLLFTKKPEKPLKALEEAISNGNLTNMTVEAWEPAASAFKETTILGLKRTIFICVVAFAAGVCILGVTVIIFILVTRRSQRRRAKIYDAKPEKSVNVTEPQGLLFKNSGEKGNGIDETIHDHPDQSKDALTQL